MDLAVDAILQLLDSVEAVHVNPNSIKALPTTADRALNNNIMDA